MRRSSAPRLTDIAKRAGVSIAAVSIALNKSESNRVSAERRQKILSIAEEMGYVPNELARALAERRTRLLGLVVPLRDPIFFNQFIAQALSGIQTTLMKRGYNLLVFSPSGKPGRATRDQILESRFMDGLVFINTRSCTASDVSRTIEELDRAQVKFSMINSYYGRAPINGDIAVLNRGNSTPEHHLRPKPTTLVTPTFRMGELAAELLIDSIEKPGTTPQRVLLPFELVQGTTT